MGRKIDPRAAWTLVALAYVDLMLCVNAGTVGLLAWRVLTRSAAAP